MSLARLIRHIRPAPLQVFVIKALGLDRRRVVDYQDYRFFVDPSSHLGIHLIESAYEDDMVETLGRFLKPGSSFLDVGANEGFFTVLGSRLVGAAGRVVAVEPQSRLIPVIEKNLMLNDCTNCVVRECVIGDHTGVVTLHLAPATNTGSSSLFALTHYRLKTQEVKSITLQDLLDESGVATVDLMKMDVEGAEYDILMPAGDILKTGRIRTIALEYHPVILKKRGLSMDPIHKLLTQCGYRLNPDFAANSLYEFQ